MMMIAFITLNSSLVMIECLCSSNPWEFEFSGFRREDLVKKSGLRRILFDEPCLRRISFHRKSGLRRIFFIQH